jgi:hypothetical protein
VESNVERCGALNTTFDRIKLKIKILTTSYFLFVKFTMIQLESNIRSHAYYQNSSLLDQI